MEESKMLSLRKRVLVDNGGSRNVPLIINKKKKY